MTRNFFSNFDANNALKKIDLGTKDLKCVLRLLFEAKGSNCHMEQSEIDEIVTKYEQKNAGHKQAKALQELYLSEKNILLELHEKECTPICITTEIVNIERESSKMIIEHQEKKIQSLEKKIERMKNSMTKKIEIDNLKDELLQSKSRYQDFQEKYLNQCITLEQTKDLVGNLSEKNHLFKATVSKLQNEKNELSKKLIKVRDSLKKPKSESKGQLISECLLGVIAFPKNQRKI